MQNCNNKLILSSIITTLLKRHALNFKDVQILEMWMDSFWSSGHTYNLHAQTDVLHVEIWMMILRQLGHM